MRDSLRDVDLDAGQVCAHPLPRLIGLARSNRGEDRAMLADSVLRALRDPVDGQQRAPEGVPDGVHAVSEKPVAARRRERKMEADVRVDEALAAVTRAERLAHVREGRVQLGHVRVVVTRDENGRDKLGLEFLDGPVTPRPEKIPAVRPKAKRRSPRPRPPKRSSVLKVPLAKV